MKRHLIMIMAIALVLAVATPVVMGMAVTEDYRTNSDIVVAEVMPVATTEVSQEDMVKNILLEESSVLIVDTLPAKTVTTNILEEKPATDGKTSVLFVGLTEVEVLAKFLQHEGGELFERTLVAQIVVDILKSDNCPHDSLKALLGDERYFYIHEPFWRKMGLIEEENLMIAQMVLDMSEQNDDLTSYDGYYYRFVVEDYPAFPFLEDKETITTDNYVFFKMS